MSPVSGGRWLSPRRHPMVRLLLLQSADGRDARNGAVWRRGATDHVSGVVGAWGNNARAIHSRRDEAVASEASLAISLTTRTKRGMRD